MLRPVVELTVGVGDVDAASDVLWANGASAIEERPGSDGRIVLVADAEPSAVERMVMGRWPMVLALVDPDAALDGWRPYARVVRAGRRIVVRPPWLAFPADPDDRDDQDDHDDLVLDIDPEHAFGSGSHPSTRLALAAIDSLGTELLGASVLDIGCGSGVLAVAAARLGAARVVAVDIDPAALRATAANAERNGVADRVASIDGTVEGVAGRFDLVLVNISRAASIELAPAVTALTRPGGCAVVAGFLAGHGNEVAAAYPSMAAEAHFEDAGWGALLMRAGAAEESTRVLSP